MLRPWVCTNVGSPWRVEWPCLQLVPGAVGLTGQNNACCDRDRSQQYREYSSESHLGDGSTDAEEVPALAEWARAIFQVFMVLALHAYDNIKPLVPVVDA